MRRVTRGLASLRANATNISNVPCKNAQVQQKRSRKNQASGLWLNLRFSIICIPWIAALNAKWKGVNVAVDCPAEVPAWLVVLCGFLGDLP